MAGYIVLTLLILCFEGQVLSQNDFTDQMTTTDSSISEVQETTTSRYEETRSSSDIYQEYFNQFYNETAVNISGHDLPKPSTMTDYVLRGLNGYGLDSLIFPRSFKDMLEPLKTFLNLLLRIPVIVIGLIVGENAELLGLQTMQMGNALLLSGARGWGMSLMPINRHSFIYHPFLGYTLREHAIGFIAFGRTVKEWFVNNNLPSFNGTDSNEDFLVQHSGEGPSYGYYWNKIGNSFLETRLEIEELYGNRF